MIDKMSRTIFDKKGFNILALDVRGNCSLTDYLLIAEGHAERHVISIAKAIIDSAPTHPIRVEGLANGDWVVLDFSDIIVHLFRPGMREKYSLERLWKESRIIDLNLIA